jgi:hypothetical protein
MEAVTGTPDSPVFIKDVVERVKCELADAFGDKINNPQYYWLRTWTVKADLTLIVTDSGSLTPSVVTTTYFQNAFNYAAGSSSLTSRVIAPLQQSFSFGAGATWNEQPARQEGLSFSLALNDLGAVSQPCCCGLEQPGLIGGLGLKEWIDSAIYPVDEGLLTAGDHPHPGASPQAKLPTATQPSGPRGGGVEGACKKLLEEQKVSVSLVSDPSELASDLIDLASKTNMRILDFAEKSRRWQTTLKLT